MTSALSAPTRPSGPSPGKIDVLAPAGPPVRAYGGAMHRRALPATAPRRRDTPVSRTPGHLRWPRPAPWPAAMRRPAPSGPRGGKSAERMVPDYLHMWWSQA